jgi:hypothetical protein
MRCREGLGGSQGLRVCFFERETMKGSYKTREPTGVRRKRLRLRLVVVVAHCVFLGLALARLLSLNSRAIAPGEADGHYSTSPSGQARKTTSVDTACIRYAHPENRR